MRERKPQCTVTSHGNAGDRASSSPGDNPVFSFNVWHELLQEEIAIPHGTIRRIDVEAAPSVRCCDQKVSHLLLLSQIVQQSPTAAVKKRLLVVTEPMKEIENGISF